MLQSKLFYKTTKNKTAGVDSISHDFLTRAGYIDQLMAGVYSFLPLGFMVLKNIEAIIRKNMEEIGVQELLLPVLQPKENWVKTDRINIEKEILIKDLYSFHATQKDLEEYYEVAAKAYEKIYKECGIGKTTYRTFASGGSFSKYSDEFQTVTPA